MIGAPPKTRQREGERAYFKRQTNTRSSFSSTDLGPPPLKKKKQKMSNPSRCPYAALGLPRSADASSIKRAFVEAAKKSHPDTLPSTSTAAEKAAAAARFAAVAEAYSVLGDASKKAAFDRTGGRSSSAPGSGNSYYNRSNAYNPYSGGFRPNSSSSSSSRTQRPPSFLSNLLRLVVARSTRGDAWAHVALAAAALGGAALAATAGDDLWKSFNKGKLFDDVVVEADRRRQRRKEVEEERERESSSAARSAAAAAASTAPSPPEAAPALSMSSEEVSE